MNQVMMILGEYKFAVGTAAYQAIRRSTEYRWQIQQRISNHDSIQFTGKGADTITIDGVIIPQYRSGLGQIDDMRKIAETGKPQRMIDSRGNILGMWVITKITESQRVFAVGGIPKKQEFTMSLTWYGDKL